MAGINHLYDIYNKKGKKFVEELFTSYVTVNEKMDGSSFNFERDRETGKFKYFKRNQTSQITLVDRTISKYYEKPINYLESLPPHILERIPRGWRFGLEYFANTQPVEISYDRLPKNNLILSYVHVKDELGKIKRTIQDKEKLDTFADLLGVERPPIIFQGNLDDSQKNSILEFLNTPFSKLVEKFKTNSFVAYMLGVLNPDLDKTALNNNAEKSIEGIVFRFGDLDNEDDPILAKMVDPVFTELAKERAKNRVNKKPSDFLGIALVDVMNFILERGVDSFNVDGEGEDERYVSFMSDVFVEFLEVYSEKYKGIDFQEPEYLKREEFRLNKEMIQDERVEELLKQDDGFESLFKLMLNSFRKIRKRSGGIITKDVIEHFNSVVNGINKYIEKKDSKIEESEIPSFSTFRKTHSSQKVDYVTEEDDDEENGDLGDNDIFYSFNEFRSAMETIEEQNDDFVEKTKAKNKINLIIGRMQPFHKGHLRMAKDMQEENKLPTYVAVVHPGHNRSGKSPFDIDTVNKYMQAVKESNDVIEDFSIFNRGFIGEILEELDGKGYTVNLLGCGDDRNDDYKKQLQYLKNTDASGLIGDKFKIFPTKRMASGTEIRSKLADGNFSEFKKLTTPEVSSLYNMLNQFVKVSVNEVESFIDPTLILNETLELVQDLVPFFSKDKEPNTGMSATSKKQEKQLKRMRKIIEDFNTFQENRKNLGKFEEHNVAESDGFGTSQFFSIKDEERTHYYFTLERDNKDGEQNIGVHLQFGNYSEYEAVEGPKNSYFVMNMNQISVEKVQDLSRGTGEPGLIGREKFKVDDAEMSRLYKLISKCILDHLENEPKVTRIYDELQDNLEFDGDYIEYMKSIVISFLGEEWTVQEGSHENLVLLIR